MDERDRVAIGRANRQAEPFARKLPGKRHDAGRGSLDVGAGVGGDVDPTMLAARVRVVLGDERAEHRAFDRPRPGRRRLGEHEGEQGAGRADEESVADLDNHDSTLAGESAVVKYGYSDPR